MSAGDADSETSEGTNKYVYAYTLYYAMSTLSIIVLVLLFCQKLRDPQIVKGQLMQPVYHVINNVNVVWFTEASIYSNRTFTINFM